MVTKNNKETLLNDIYGEKMLAYADFGVVNAIHDTNIMNLKPKTDYMYDFICHEVLHYSKRNDKLLNINIPSKRYKFSK